MDTGTETVAGELVTKAEILDINNGWNDQNQEAMEDLADQIASRRWKHSWASARYKVYHNVLSISLVLFSSALSAESLVPEDDGSTLLNVTRRLFTYTITVLTFLQSFLKYQQVSNLLITSGMKSVAGFLLRRYIISSLWRLWYNLLNSPEL